MPYLIDASNLGGVLAGWAGSRDALGVVRFLLPWARSRGRVVLVFDGQPRSEVADRYGNIEVRWSRGVSGDDLIRSQVISEPGPWIVITDDVELASSCRELGASVERATALSGRLARGKGAERPAFARDFEGAAGKPAASASDVAYWRRVFGVEPTSGRRRRGG